MAESQLTVEVRPFERGQLKAFADVTIATAIGEITLRGFRVIQKDGEAPWVGFPATTYMKDGKTVNKPVLEVPRALHRQITEQILAEFRRSKQAV